MTRKDELFPPRDTAPSARRLEELAATLRAAAPVLDDLTRARVEARLAAPPRAFFGSWARLTVGFCGAALAAAGAVALLVSRSSAGLLEPCVVALPPAADSEVRATRMLARATDEIDVPAGARVEATLGEQGLVALVGPGQMRAHREGDEVVLRLEGGTMLARWQHGSGRLRVEAAGLRAVVVGTVFAVTCDERGAEVGVLEGVVQVGGDRVAGGSAWRGGNLAPLRPEVARSLSAHAERRFARGEPIVELVGQPERAQVWVTGHYLGDTPLWTRLSPGTTVRVVAEGRTPLEVEIPSGDAPRRTMSLGLAKEPEKSATAPPIGDPAATKEETPGLARPPLEPPRAQRPLERPSPRREGSTRSTTLALAVPEEPRSSAPAPEPPEIGLPQSPEPESAAAKQPSAALLYDRADRALREGDRDGARAALLEVAARHRETPLGQQALYELARLAWSAREWSSARRYLDQMEAGNALEEPAGSLRCWIDLSADAGFASCLTFRRRFPSSVHDAQILAQLALRASCAQGRALAAEYLARYSNEAAAEEVRRRSELCAGGH
jgi:hypothetical protein